MDCLASLTCFALAFMLLLSFFSIFPNRPSKLRRPPGPPGWPVIGNILELGTQPHQDFYTLKSRYGPVLWLKLGNLNAVVIQSAAAAAELFKKHDHAFADRKTPNSMTACDYINSSLAFASYVVDAFECLKWIDPQGIRRRTKKHLEQLLDIVSVFVKERIKEKNMGKGNDKRDFLDALLEYEGDGKGSINKLSEKDINIITLEMFFGGTETTSNTTTCAMAELLRNPDSMRKLKAEINEVIGSSRAVEEKDIDELTYLQAVTKETMRSHPGLPLLLPRKAREDTVFMGYNIPKDTAVFVNAWAIQRDPESWEDPFAFKPERFLESSIDHNGQHYEMIPFGAGRRSCISMLMGNKMVSLTLARLLQSFDWELPANVSPETLDMREMTGLSLRMLTPLQAIPTERGR